MLRRARGALLVFAITLAALYSAPARSTTEPIDTDSWIYSAMRTFELEGLVVLPSHMPWTRSEAESLLDRILANLGESGILLTPREEYLLDRLRKELQGMGPRPSGREDAPVRVLREGARWAALDLAAGTSLEKDPDVDKGQWTGEASPEFLFDSGRGVSAGASYRLRMRPERGKNSSRYKPSPRERSFRGVTSEYERGWVSWQAGRALLKVGRDYVHWGSGMGEGMILSRSAGTLDHMGLDVSLGRFRFHGVQAFLGPAGRRHLAGHRLEISLPASVRIGVSETVVYAGRDLDWAYLIPFGSFYANQYNESEDDNILWAMDFKVPLRRGLIVRGELLVDDFQYENRGEAPDRLGMNLGVEALLRIAGREIEAAASYTRIGIYTYAHKDSLLTRYTAGEGSAGDRLLGSSLGPDADRLRLSLRLPVTARLLMTVAGSLTRRGEGNDLREWIPGTDPDLPFPSGTVTREKELFIGMTMDLGGGSMITAGGGIRAMSGEEGKSEDGYGHLGFLLDL